MKKKIIIGIAVAVLVVLLAWYFFLKPTPEEELESITGEKTTTKSAVGNLKNKLAVWLTPGNRNYKPEPAVFDSENPIAQGMAGPKTLQLQKYLNKNFNAKLTEDGKWWDDTQTAFIAAKFPIPDQAGRIYSVLTKSLYDKLELSKY
jgi:hypothetical protein